MKQYPTRAQAVADFLRKEILSGALEPGQELSHDDLATRYNVSRILVPEALRSLAAEHLVELRPHRAPRVRLHSPDEIQEVWWIRQRLESEAARRAAPRLTAGILAALERIHRRMEGMGPLPDPARWLAANRSLHLSIYAAADRPRLQALIAEIYDQSERYIGVYLKSPDEFSQAHGGARRAPHRLRRPRRRSRRASHRRAHRARAPLARRRLPGHGMIRRFTPRERSTACHPA
jgi:DNA-binding GntR family transcriptional regulator